MHSGYQYRDECMHDFCLCVCVHVCLFMQNEYFNINLSMVCTDLDKVLHKTYYTFSFDGNDKGMRCVIKRCLTFLDGQIQLQQSHLTVLFVCWVAEKT